MLSSFRQVHCL